jgi:pyruvate/2-oxoglutarate dehydrogenase complex dihydrolipoamide acyltransferase (E2) component
MQELSAQAREGKSKPEDLQGSNFTITSLGKTGGLFATPIINYPEVAIMGIHKMEKRPVVASDGSIVARDRMNLSFSFDHRVIDGAVGAEFAHAIIRYLEDPKLLLLEGA